MWLPVLLRAITQHLTHSESALWLKPPYTEIPSLPQLCIATPQLYHYCVHYFDYHRVFLYYVKYITWNEFCTLYAQLQFKAHYAYYYLLAEALIQFHRPTQFLNYHCQQQSLCTPRLCDCAAQYNNIPALETLRDPNTGSGVCAWNRLTCCVAIIHNQLDALIWLRDPTKGGGGVCEWDHLACASAAENGHLHILKWLRNPTTGGGVCDWDPQQCLELAHNNHHVHIVTWIRAQLHNNS